MRWAKKGSYFYVLDAFIGAIIVLGGITILFSQFGVNSQSTASFFTSEDLFDVLENTQIRTLDNDDVRNLIATKYINDTSVSVLEQLALFKVQGNTEELEKLGTIILNSLPENVGATITVDNTVAVTKTTLVSREESFVEFTGQRIIVTRKNPWEIHPPIIIEVAVWQ